MQNSLARKLFRNGFWLSLLLHILLMLCFLTVVVTQPEQEKKPPPPPHYYVPAYTYTGSIKPSAPKQQAAKNVQKNKAVQQEEAAQTINKTTDRAERAESADNLLSVEHTESPLLVPKKTKKISKPTIKKYNQSFSQSLLAASLNMLKEDQMKEITKKRESEPIYLIGDDNAPADPLIKLLGRSLSAHFQYPQLAGELGIKGRVLVELTLHPEGHYTDVRMVKSSNSQDLDAAALYAVNSAPIVEGADRFISKPKHFVVGFVFH